MGKFLLCVFVTGIWLVIGQFLLEATIIIWNDLGTIFGLFIGAVVFLPLWIAWGIIAIDDVMGWGIVR